MATRRYLAKNAEASKLSASNSLSVKMYWSVAISPMTHEKKNCNLQRWITTHKHYKMGACGTLSPAQRKKALQLKQQHLNYKNSANQ